MPELVDEPRVRIPFEPVLQVGPPRPGSDVGAGVAAQAVDRVVEDVDRQRLDVRAPQVPWRTSRTRARCFLDRNGSPTPVQVGCAGGESQA